MLAATLVCILAQAGAAQADSRWSIFRSCPGSRGRSVENPSRYDTAELVPHFYHDTREQGAWAWRVAARAGRTVSWSTAEQLDARALSVEFAVMPR